MSQHTTNTDSTTSLLTQALFQLAGLFRREVDLARAEAVQMLRAAIAGIALMLGAFIVAITGLNALIDGLMILAVAYGATPMHAAFLVGGALLGLALVLFLIGRAMLTPRHAPNRATVRPRDIA